MRNPRVADRPRKLLEFCCLLQFLILAAPTNANPDLATPDRKWIHESITSQLAKFQSTTILPHPKQKNLLAMYCERDPKWWGHLRVFQHTGDKVDWAATFPDIYLKQRGHYIRSYRWVQLEKLDKCVLELFESSHMGNGSLWLLELKGREFQVLLQTSAVGRYWSTSPELGIPLEGEARFAGNHLNASYPIPNGADHEAVRLTGQISVTDSEGKEVHQRPYLETWTWDDAKQCFAKSQ